MSFKNCLKIRHEIRSCFFLFWRKGGGGKFILRKSPNCEMCPNFLITALPTFFDEFRYCYHATPQWNMSRTGRVYERCCGKERRLS